MAARRKRAKRKDLAWGICKIRTRRYQWTMVISDCLVACDASHVYIYIYIMLFFACSWDFCVDICHNSSQHEPSQSRKQGELKPNTNTICKKENNEDPTASPRRSAGGYLRAESIPLLLPGASWSCHGGDWSAWGRMECSSRGDTTKILKRKWYWKEKKKDPGYFREI